MTKTKKETEAAAMRETMRAPSPQGSKVAPDLNVDPTAITSPAFATGHPNPEKDHPEAQVVEPREKEKESWRRDKKGKEGEAE